MCLNCGCGNPDDRHGDDANIVTEDLRRAGSANDQDLATTVSNMEDSLGMLDTGSSEVGNSLASQAPR